MKADVSRRKVLFEEWYTQFVPQGAQRYKTWLAKTKEKQLYYKEKPQPLPNGTKTVQTIDLALYPTETAYEFSDPNEIIPLYADCPRQRFADDGSFHSGLGYYMLWLRIQNPYRWAGVPFFPDDAGRQNGLSKNGFNFSSKWENAMSKVGNRQLIVYGAPGTGKSFLFRKETAGNETIRTTFHPDSDYSTFVGSYKPTVNDGVITYRFVEQAFLQAYVEAWKYQNDQAMATGIKPVFLVIEEINRGNCAQIFGDLFQLLDRDDDGWSSYPVNADTDLKTFLAPIFNGLSNLNTIECPKDIEENDWLAIKEGRKLLLPPNLYIWATMNTSDQSLFPIDSAFKRRWDWKYIPIAKPSKPGWKERKIVADGKAYDWWNFVSIVNAHIATVTKSEDKQMGYFFVKAPDETGIITAERFANKVLFYLFNDVFKDWDLPMAIFGKDDQGSTKYAFKDFFYDKIIGDHIPGDVKEDVVAAFIEQQKYDGMPNMIGIAQENPSTTTESSTDQGTVPATTESPTELASEQS